MTQENSIRVYINNKRDKTFSFESVQTAITFGTFNLKLNDVIDIETSTNTGEITADDRSGHFEISMSWTQTLIIQMLKKFHSPNIQNILETMLRIQELFSGDPIRYK